MFELSIKMPFGVIRRYAPKRRLIRRKRLARRPFKAVRRMPRGQPNVYNFKRTQFYQNSFSITAAGADYSQAWDFRFGLLPNSTDFTNLYDMYMIKKVVMKIIPKFTQENLISGASNADLPQIHSAIDYDDSVNPASIQTLCEYQSHRMTRGTQIHTRVLVPKVELSAEGAVGAATIAPKAYQWLDSDNTTAVHRGVKVYIPKPLTASTSLTYDVQIVYYFSCKNVN